MKIMEISYRSWLPGLPPPQPIKLKILGWAGDSHGHSTGDKPQPWHCGPFVDGSTYGLELLYPFETECRVTTGENNVINFDGDLQAELREVFKEELHQIKELGKFPFGQFSPNHYGLTSSFDIKGPPDHSLRLEAHPSYYTDTTWTTPLVVPGHIQYEWWTKIFFVAFKAPPLGHVHVFRKNQPYAQLFFVPRKVSYEISPMTPEEASFRQKREQRIDDVAEFLADNIWTDKDGRTFDDKYKVLRAAFNKGGQKGLDQCLFNALLKASE